MLLVIRVPDLSSFKTSYCPIGLRESLSGSSLLVFHFIGDLPYSCNTKLNQFTFILLSTDTFSGTVPSPLGPLLKTTHQDFISYRAKAPCKRCIPSWCSRKRRWSVRALQTAAVGHIGSGPWYRHHVVYQLYHTYLGHRLKNNVNKCESFIRHVFILHSYNNIVFWIIVFSYVWRNLKVRYSEGSVHKRYLIIKEYCFGSNSTTIQSQSHTSIPMITISRFYNVSNIKYPTQILKVIKFSIQTSLMHYAVAFVILLIYRPGIFLEILLVWRTENFHFDWCHRCCQ